MKEPLKTFVAYRGRIARREATNWQNTHSRPLRMTPLYDPARDRLYAGTTDGHLYCIENL